MNFRGLFKYAGICAIGFAIVSLASYVASVSANGFLIASSTPFSPDRIYSMLQLRWNHIATRLDLISYFLLIPSLVGIFAYLRERRPGRAHLGLAFAAFAQLGFFTSSAMGSAVIGLVQAPLTDSLKERLAAMDLLSFSFFLPALYSMAAANLLLGSALRTQAGLATNVGNFFLVQVAGFLIASAGFIANQDVVGNIGILINLLAMVATYVAAGVLLRQTSKDETETKVGSHERPRAAGASA